MSILNFGIEAGRLVLHPLWMNNEYLTMVKPASLITRHGFIFFLLKMIIGPFLHNCFPWERMMKTYTNKCTLLACGPYGLMHAVHKYLSLSSSFWTHNEFLLYLWSYMNTLYILTVCTYICTPLDWGSVVYFIAFWWNKHDTKLVKPLYENRVTVRAHLIRLLLKNKGMLDSSTKN